MLFRHKSRFREKENRVKRIKKVPEREDTMRLQVEAFLDGRKPSVLFLNRDPEKYFNNLEDFKVMEIDQGIVVFKDMEIALMIERGELGKALGYGVNNKPPKGTGINITAYIGDVPVVDIQASKGNEDRVIEAAKKIAGPDCTIRYRTNNEVLKDRKCGLIM